MVRLFLWRRRTAVPDARRLELERALAEARLELAERDRLIEQLRHDLSRVRAGADEELRQHTRAGFERLVSAIGTPMVQLVTQDHLHASGAAEVRVADVLAAAMRLVRALGGEGVELVGTVGATEPFDPDRHDPLSMGAAPRAGEPVVVRMAGISYLGTVVRKAGVDPLGS